MEAAKLQRSLVNSAAARAEALRHDQLSVLCPVANLSARPSCHHLMHLSSSFQRLFDEDHVQELRFYSHLSDCTQAEDQKHGQRHATGGNLDFWNCKDLDPVMFDDFMLIHVCRCQVSFFSFYRFVFCSFGQYNCVAEVPRPSMLIATPQHRVTPHRPSLSALQSFLNLLKDCSTHASLSLDELACFVVGAS